MNWDCIEVNWVQYPGRVKERWDRLTHVNLQAIAGRRDQLVRNIVDAYGVTRKKRSVN